MIYPINWQWLNDWSHALLVALFVREFLNNLLTRTPSLKSNTIFECFYNTLDSAITTVQSIGNKAPQPEQVIPQPTTPNQP